MDAQMKKQKGAIGWIAGFAGKKKAQYGISVVLAICSTACGVTPYILISMLVNALIQGERNIAYYLVMCAIIAGLFVAKNVFYSISTVCSHNATFAVLAGIRQSLCEKLTKVPLGFVKDIPSGTLKNIMMERVDSIETILAHVLPEFTSNLLVPMFLYVYMLVVDWRLALVALVPVVVGFMLSMGMYAGYEQNHKNALAKTKALNDTAVEYINGIEVIKAFGKAKSSYEKFVIAAREGADCFIQWMKRANIFHTAALTLTPYTLVAILPVGAYFFMQGTITGTALITMIILAIGLISPLITLMSYMDDIGQARTVLKEVTGILEEPELVRPEVSKAQPSDHSIALKDVRFSYHEKEILHGIDLVMADGSINAIVGPSGSGKSTIAKLIASLWDPDSGKIEIGGVDIKEIAPDDYHKLIAYVSQENFLFDKTVKENIRLGNPEASDEAVMEIAKKSGCHDFIMKLEHGYETVVGGAGGHLSGGERQRISIARAMLKDAPIVILDEATAYTDPENEALIQRSVAALIQGKTLIVIAHRLSTITDADNIFVVNQGKIEQAGTHKELLEYCGLYREMWQAHIAAKDGLKEGAGSC